MVSYNGPVLPLQWKSTDRSQVSKRVCLCSAKVLFMDTTTWTRPLYPLPLYVVDDHRLMLAVFLNSIGHFICLLFCSETGSLTELSGSARLLASEPQGDLPVSASTTPELQAYPCAAISGTFHGFWGCQLSLSCLCDKHSPKWPHLPQSLPSSLCALKLFSIYTIPII